MDDQRILIPVSYTHLDVYKRQIPHRLKHTPIIPVQSDKGEVKLRRYKSNNLIAPLVDNILSEDLAGTACVLTKTNDEALQITGLLLKNGMQAKLIDVYKRQP